MAHEQLPTSLVSRSFSLADQATFARFSGDYNPIHVDPVAARRTMIGSVVVHGVHVAMTGLEALLRQLGDEVKPGATLTRWSVQLPKPVLVGDSVAFVSTVTAADTVSIVATIGSVKVCVMSVIFGEPTAVAAPSTTSSLSPMPNEPLVAPTFEELRTASGTLALGIDPTLAAELFPRCLRVFGPGVLSEMVAWTRLVGMRAPGLNSLFSSFDVKSAPAPDLATLTYKVDKSDERFNKLNMSVNGPLFKGGLVVFFRPPQLEQAGMAAIAQEVSPQSYRDNVALVVGGSRGLGEVTAKIIAAGGGLPIITYHSGAADAERVAADIRQAGGRCEIVKFDVLNDLEALGFFLETKTVPTSIYYFATPKIIPRRSGLIDFDLLGKFTEVYVDAFGKLVEFIAAQSKQPLAVFYPSTVFVVEKPADLAEYYLAKQLGEEFCAYYSQYSPRVHIDFARLPRVKTDQTATLVAHEMEDGLDVMLPLVEKTERHLKTADDTA